MQRGLLSIVLPEGLQGQESLEVSKLMLRPEKVPLIR